MKSIKRNFASLGVRKGAARCRLASSQIGGGNSSRFISRLLSPLKLSLLFALFFAQGAMAQLNDPYYYAPAYDGEIVYTTEGNKENFYPKTETEEKHRWICSEATDKGEFEYRGESVTKPEIRPQISGDNNYNYIYVNNSGKRKIHAYVTGISSLTVFAKTFNPANFKVEIYNTSTSTRVDDYYNTLGDRTEDQVTFTKLEKADKYEVVISNDASKNLHLIALQFFTNKLFDYTLQETANPRSPLTSTQNGITMSWGNNSVYQNGDKNYMKTSSTAMTLTGVKAGDEIALYVWNRDNVTTGLKFFEGATEKEEVKPQTSVGYIRYTVKSKCSSITIKRNGNNFLYINQIEVIRDQKIRITSPTTIIDMEKGDAGVDLPAATAKTTNGSTLDFPLSDFSYSIENQNVAKIENGKIVPVSGGKTKLIINCNNEDNFYKVTPCTITVNVISHTTGICLNETSVSIPAGDNVRLTTIFTPEDATNQVVTWSTSDMDVARVENGVVTGIGEGTATITATTIENGNTFTATCVVTVTAPVKRLFFERTTYSLLAGESLTLTAYGTLPDDNATLTWQVLKSDGITSYTGSDVAGFTSNGNNATVAIASTANPNDESGKYVIVRASATDGGNTYTADCWVYYNSSTHKGLIDFITVIDRNGIEVSPGPERLEENNDLESYLFYEPYRLKVGLKNPFDDGTKVYYRYHVHDKADPTKNYDENERILGNGGTVTLPEMKNSFVIYAELRDEDGVTVLSGTRTYEFIYIDKMVYYVAQHGLTDTNFTLRIGTDGKVSYSSSDSDRPNDTPESQFSVRGLKMTYGGMTGQEWNYKKATSDDSHVGSDGVLTYNGYCITTSSYPTTEDKERYDHRFAVKDTSWDNVSSPYHNGINYITKATTSTGTFSLPVDGCYVKFEAERNGTIILHIFQRGNTYHNTNDNKAPNNISMGVENHPFYFLDEAGKSLKMKSYSTTSSIDFDEYNKRIVYRSDHLSTAYPQFKDDEEHLRRGCNKFMIDRGYATMDLTRPAIIENEVNKETGDKYNSRNKYEAGGACVLGDGKVVPTAIGEKKPQELIVLYSAKSSTPDVTLPQYIIDHYGGYSDELVDYIDYSEGSATTREYMKDGTGFMLINDGFIKYAFDVEAGKTYFAFVTKTTFGMCGYEFIPNQPVYEVEEYADETDDPNSTFKCNNMKAGRPIVLSDEESYDNLKVLSGLKGQQCDVTLRRSFTKDVWTPIVLPFSVSATKLETLFGKGTKVIHFDNILKTAGEGGPIYTLMLRKHYYDMIVAGTPVYIRPANDIPSEVEFNNVTIEVTSDSELDPVANYQFNKNTKIQNGCMVSSFNADEIEYFGLYLSGDRFYQNRLSGNRKIPIKPLRGWIKASAPITTNAKMMNLDGEDFDFDNDVLDIDFIEIDDGDGCKTYSNDKVYNMNGQMVGASFTDIDTLPNGIYIVNGKKFTVNNK